MKGILVKEMIEIRIDGELYDEKQFRKDFVRYFKTEIGKRREHSAFKEENCSNLPCAVCIVNISNIDSYSFTQCQQNLFNSFEGIKKIHDWAKEHPIVTNRDKLREVFGFDKIHCKFSKSQLEIVYHGTSKTFTCDNICDFFEWFEQEYKESEKK